MNGLFFLKPILSGYYPDEEIYTKGLNWKLIQNYLDEIENFVKDKKCHCLLIGHWKFRPAAFGI
jgi:hypothetical protein